MENIQDLIQYENENTSLDFKRDEYKKENYSSLLKDIISMANANIEGNRFIIVGLKPNSKGNRGIKGISKDLVDSATYQQLIFENIEPEISIEYYPFHYENLTFGVIRIYNCKNPPYLMKKDYGNEKNKLNRGEGFIRKGTHQTRLTRGDYNNFYETKSDSKYFNDEIKFTLISDEGINKISLTNIGFIKLPSQLNKEKIEAILKRKRLEDENIPIKFSSTLPAIPNFTDLLLGRVSPYEKRDIPTLELNLKNINETYYDDDLYVLLEKESNKCNIRIHNKGNSYIEDASIKLIIPNYKGLIVVKEVYENPEKKFPISMPNLNNINYPNVTENKKYYEITYNIGNIKHQIEQDVFQTKLRIFTSTKLGIETLFIDCELFAKNIKTSIKQTLKVNIS